MVLKWDLLGEKSKHWGVGDNDSGQWENIFALGEFGYNRENYTLSLIPVF